MKGWRFEKIGDINTASLEELKTIPKSASRIGKSADISVLYLKRAI